MRDIEVNGDNNKIVRGDDNSETHHHYPPIKQGRLSILFNKLKEKFEEGNRVQQICDDLKRYMDPQDTIGLEEKLKRSDREHFIRDYRFCKQEFYKKLVRYQNYEPAQEIFALVLAIILEKHRSLIIPKIKEGALQVEISKLISENITNPILSLILAEGCDDIMKLSSTEIEGMFHYLTGNCHIDYKL